MNMGEKLNAGERENEDVQDFADRRGEQLPPSKPNEERAFKKFIRAHQWENSARHEQAGFGGPNGI